MSNQTAPPAWVDVHEAALLVGKSVSTIRRQIPEIEAAAPASIRREPLEGKGGEKVLFERAYLLERYGVRAPEPQEPPGDEAAIEAGGEVRALVELLEHQIAVKDRQIERLQNDSETKSRLLDEAQRAAADLSERLGQTVAINAVLQQRILSLTDRAGGVAPPAAGKGESVLSSPAYFVALSVALALIIGLLLYLLLY